jgi:hypothetical protein
MAMTISDDSVVSRNPEIALRNVDKEFIALDPKRGLFFSLNETAEFVFRSLNGTRTVHEVIDRMLDEYEVDRETCRAAVLKSVSILVEHNFAQIV